MMKHEARGVKKRPGQPLHRLDIRDHTTMDAAVHGVAHDGVTDGTEVHADLVRTPRVDRHLAERERWHVMRAGDPGDRVAGVFRPRRHLLAVRRVAADGGIDAAACLHVAPHQRDVFLLDFVIVELSRELVVGRIVLRDDHKPGGPTIEAVHDAWPELASHSAQVRQVVQQRVHDRARGMTCAGMDDHAGGLVEDGEVTILVDDIERQRLAGDR